ncbi:hypothetical protein CP97_14813 [Aurantiacibacter atlanticus]|uniref:Uncharacterized protein n=1 Tax=Aurantiacibacter atlanticus TaxID=1648404 RepID=A0A161J4E6_9SPHN|nr:hypothetical protein CP97_14813 [Aurantiacibacter atlanticus]
MAAGLIFAGSACAIQALQSAILESPYWGMELMKGSAVILADLHCCRRLDQ